MQHLSSVSFWAMVAVSVLSAIFSGAVTQIVIMLWQKHRECYRQKYDVFMTVLGSRYDFNSETMINALNTIDLVWYKNDAVRQALRRVINESNKPEDGSVSREDAVVKLLETMAQDLSFPKIKWDDIKNCYCPSQYLERRELSRAVKSKKRK